MIKAPSSIRSVSTERRPEGSVASSQAQKQPVKEKAEQAYSRESDLDMKWKGTRRLGIRSSAESQAPEMPRGIFGWLCW